MILGAIDAELHQDSDSGVKNVYLESFRSIFDRISYFFEGGGLGGVAKRKNNFPCWGLLFCLGPVLGVLWRS